MRKYFVLFIFVFLLFSEGFAASYYNYPNPFYPAKGQTTEIVLPSNRTVNAYIYNVVGQRIRKLTGTDKIVWDGTNDFGELVSADVYLVYLVSDNRQLGKCKIVVLK